MDTSKYYANTTVHITNMVFPPCITEGMTVFLNILLKSISLFTDLYPQNNFEHKRSFLMSLRQVGPLVHVWNMRHEAKQKFCKSSKNTSRTLTTHQSMK